MNRQKKTNAVETHVIYFHMVHLTYFFVVPAPSHRKRHERTFAVQEKKWPQVIRLFIQLFSLNFAVTKSVHIQYWMLHIYEYTWVSNSYVVCFRMQPTLQHHKPFTLCAFRCVYVRLHLHTRLDKMDSYSNIICAFVCSVCV